MSGQNDYEDYENPLTIRWITSETQHPPGIGDIASTGIHGPNQQDSKTAPHQLNSKAVDIVLVPAY